LLNNCVDFYNSFRHEKRTPEEEAFKVTGSQQTPHI